MRLDKLLANLGYGSRRDVQSLCRAGRVSLDGVAIRDAEQRLAAEASARLVVDGETLDPLPGVVIMLNKPLGTTCSRKDAGPLVHDLLPPRWRQRDPPISPIGRLDKDTSGLLLLTDDGALLHRIISPKAHLPKRYRADLERPLRGDEAAIFAAGTLMLDGESKPLRPARLEAQTPTRATVTITEGRYHQIRRMFAAVGNHVAALHRDRVGGLTLPDDLNPGAFRVLEGATIAAIFATS